MNNIDKIKTELKSQGYKITKYRVALLNLLTKKEKPLSVSDILEYLSSKGMTPNKTTIYRELEFLLLENKVYELDLGDQVKRYELSAREHHHHLICQKCKKIQDVIIEDDLKDVEKKIKRSKKFQVTAHTLEFFGLCNRCQ